MTRFKSQKVLPLFFLNTCILLSSACISLTKIPSGFISDPFGNLIKSLERQPDPELVREGLPTLLILLDGLVSSSPKDPDLLYAATLAYGTYCQAFLVGESEWERAKKVYGHAKGYAMRLMEEMRYLQAAEDESITSLENALSRLRIKDVPHLYAIASVWLGWILTNANSMEAIADLPKALAIMDRVLELDETYNNGSLHVFYGIYFSVQPRGAGQDLEKSKTHFDRAAELGGEGNLFPLVAYAEYYAKSILDESLFVDTLNKVLQTDLELRPDVRLMNELALKRAKYLLANKDDLF
jgi:tetratricopeptide (TPR) repeat protein